MSSVHDEACEAMETLSRSGRPSAALARVQRFMGMGEDARRSFLAGAVRMREVADTITARDGLAASCGARLDTCAAFVEGGAAAEARRLAVGLSECGESLKAPEHARLAVLFAQLGDARMAREHLTRAPEDVIAADMVRAWLAGDARGLHEAADRLEAALGEPPLGPVPPWGNSESWDRVRWARGEAVRWRAG